MHLSVKSKQDCGGGGREGEIGEHATSWPAPSSGMLLQNGGKHNITQYGL